MAIQLNNDFLIIVYKIAAKNVALQKTSYLYNIILFLCLELPFSPPKGAYAITRNSVPALEMVLYL